LHELPLKEGRKGKRGTAQEKNRGHEKSARRAFPTMKGRTTPFRSLRTVAEGDTQRLARRGAAGPHLEQ